MSELPSSSSSSELPTVLPSIEKPGFRNWLNPVYLWRTNRWLFLTYTTIVLIILLILGLVSVFIYSQLNSHPVPEPNQNPSTSNAGEPTATHNSDDDEFFTQQSLTMLYYSFAQTSGSKNMFQATVNDKESRVLDIGYPDKYEFSTSPNGKWLIRWDEDSIERASANEPQKFQTIYEIDDDNFKINSVIWQQDTGAIAIASRQSSVQGTEGSKQSRITLLPFLTLLPVSIYSQAVDFEIKFVKYPNANAVYFFESSNGIDKNLSLYNPQSKQVEKVFSDFNQNGLLAKLQFSDNMQHVYHITDTEVIRYNLQTSEQKSVYITNRQCEVGEPNSNSIRSASISPSSSKLLIIENLTKCKKTNRSRSTTPTPVPAISQTTLFSLTEEKIMKRELDYDLKSVTTGIWSPAENYVWIETETQDAIMLSVDDFIQSPVPTAERQVLTRERVFFIGWLLPKN